MNVIAQKSCWKSTEARRRLWRVHKTCLGNVHGRGRRGVCRLMCDVLVRLSMGMPCHVHSRCHGRRACAPGVTYVGTFHPRSVYSSNLTIDRRFRISSSDTLHRAHSTDSYHSTSMTRPATRSNLLVLVLLEVERDAVHAVSGISRAAMHPALKTHRSSVGVSNPSPLNTCPRCPPQFAQRI
jgi:hypothetical protein